MCLASYTSAPIQSTLAKNIVFGHSCIDNQHWSKQGSHILHHGVRFVELFPCPAVCVLLFILSSHQWKHLSLQTLIVMYCLRMLRSQSVVSVCIESKFVHSFIHELLYRVLLPCHCLSPPSSSLYVHITRTIITVQQKLWMCIWLEEQPSFTSLTDLTQLFCKSDVPIHT